MTIANFIRKLYTDKPIIVADVYGHPLWSSEDSDVLPENLKNIHIERFEILDKITLFI